MPAPRLLVVGGDAAGMSAAAHVNRARQDLDVVVLERGPYTSYSMCGIPYYLGQEITEAADLVVRWPEELREAGIDVRMATEAVDVDAGQQSVRVRDVATGAESELGYDLLLVATGAHPQVPDLPGLRAHGHVVHTLDEAEGLRRRLDAAADIHEVVVVGAGYIGLELAEALVRRGLDTRLIDQAPQVMTTLDPEPAARVGEAVAGFGVHLSLGESLKEVRSDARGSCREVVTDRGRYAADTVVLAMGSAPNVALPRAAGCAIGPSGAVAVDERMRTSVPGVWAAGDCAEQQHLVSGAPVNVQLGTHANKQGKVAGIDIAAHPDDGEATFPGVVGTSVTRVCEWEIGRTGLSAAEAQDAGIDAVATSFVGTASAGYMPEPGEVHVVLRAERGTGRVVGCQLVGTGNVAKRIDVAAVWCQLGVTVQQAQLLDLSYAPPFGAVWDLLQVGARKLTRELGLRPRL